MTEDRISENIQRLASENCVTLGHLNDDDSRELECLLERLDAAERELSARRAAETDMVLVPREPTHDMFAEGCKALSAVQKDKEIAALPGMPRGVMAIQYIYRAMLSAHKESQK